MHQTCFRNSSSSARSPFTIDTCAPGEVLPAPALLPLPGLLLHPDSPRPAPAGQGEEAGGQQETEGGIRPHGYIQIILLQEEKIREMAMEMKSKNEKSRNTKLYITTSGH